MGSIVDISDNKFMFGLKNLVPKGVLCDDNYTVLKRKSQQYRRSISYFAGHIHQMFMIYYQYSQVLGNNIDQMSTQLHKSQNANQQLYVDLLRLFIGMNGELHKFVQKASKNQKSFVQLSNTFMIDYNQLIAQFQKLARDYFDSEQNVIETCKKYFGSYKDMMNKIQAYKNSFMDVKLIYNNQQKLRLYNDCLQNYKKLQQLSKLIDIKVIDLNAKKVSVQDIYGKLRKQLENFTISFACRYIQELKKFYESLFKFQRNRLQVFAERMVVLDKSPFPSFFQSEINYSHQQLILVKINPEQCRFIPAFVVYSSKLKQEGIFRFRRCMVSYWQQMSAHAEKRRRLTRKMYEFAKNYLKSLDKTLTDLIKQTLQSFEKLRRKIGEKFGNKWIGFYKIISTIFQNYIENTGRLILRTDQTIQKIENYVAKESNFMGDFIKQLKLYVEKQVPKKIIKGYQGNNQWKKQQLMNEDKAISQQEIAQYTQFLNSLVLRYGQGSKILYQQGRKYYNQFVNDIKQSLTEFFTFFNQIQNTYYDQEEYAKTYQSFQNDMTNSIHKGMDFFDQIQLSVIMEQNKISFDNEFNKLEGFKKIKKPKQFQDLQGRNAASLNLDRQSQQKTCMRTSNNRESNESSPELLNQKDNNISNILNKQIFLGETNSRHAQYLIKKITLENNEKYIKSYSCSFSDTVILAGRLFITTHRLCFHSKFNSSNIFFGETFIEIPKNDIKKVQKRSMSFISDHAISISTVNGCMVFRSFFSRDAAYNLIKKNFQVNNDEIFFQDDEEGGGNDLMQKQIEFEDDMKEQIAKQRQAKLVKQLKSFNYSSLGQREFTCYGLTVVKFLKLFQLDQQVTVNRTTFSSFTHYFKDLCQHTQISIQPWTPNPLQYLNVVNIKQDAPQVFTRKITSIIPLPPSGIPFMPKASFTTEDQTMYLMSGDKVVMESTIKNTKVPYCQAFDVRLKRVVESTGQNKVKLGAFLCVNFNQNVMVKSTIESKTIETTKESCDKQSDEIENFLKNLQKAMMKGNKKETPEDKIKQLQEQLTEVETKLKEVKQQNKVLKQASLGFQRKFKIASIVSLTLVILVVMMTIMLFS